MDRITLTEKEQEFMCRFAAPSILTGYFVAAVIRSDRETIEEAFTEPGPILVHNMEDLYADKTYEGYRRINEIREAENEITVILDKEEPDNE